MNSTFKNVQMRLRLVILVT